MWGIVQPEVNKNAILSWCQKNMCFSQLIYLSQCFLITARIAVSRNWHSNKERSLQIYAYPVILYIEIKLAF